jgi:hypothetical protein
VYNFDVIPVDHRLLRLLLLSSSSEPASAHHLKPAPSASALYFHCLSFTCIVTMAAASAVFDSRLARPHCLPFTSSSPILFYTLSCVSFVRSLFCGHKELPLAFHTHFLVFAVLWACPVSSEHRKCRCITSPVRSVLFSQEFYGLIWYL